MSERCYAVVMAGGRGERFWPLSEPMLPKPFIPLLSKMTLIQETVERVTHLLPEERIIIVLSQDHLPLAQCQLPGIPPENFIVEPFGRDTAACIGLASLSIGRRDKDAAMVVVAADHVIRDEGAFSATLASTLRFIAAHDYLVTIGITPTRAETGYGYIEVGETVGSSGGSVFYGVKRFIEKPDLAAATTYLKAGHFYWNSGIFVWRNSTIQRMLALYMPALWSGLSRIACSVGSKEEKEVVREEFSKFEKASIDYGVLEKSPQVAVVPALFDWDDVGTWNALERISTLDEDGNVVVGKHVGKDTGNCIVFSQDQLVATFGVKDLVIAQVRGKTLVCHKDKAPQLKELLQLIKEK